jgi:DNA-binding transcriptional LysR family regulator
MRYGSRMDRALITHLPAVLAVARTRSFARAAAELGVGASAVSHAVRAVEQRIGQPLFARTTRSVSLTEAGESFVRSAQQAFDDIDAATEAVRAGQPEITGTLRINAPRIALYLGLIPILERLAVEQPQLTVEVIADDALTDVVAQGFDAGIRLGEMIAQDMIAVRMTAPLRAIMVASPAYLDAHGTPRSIEDLGEHNCIGFRLLASGAIYAWDLQEDGKDVKVSVSGSVRVSDPGFARELALVGIGIAYIFEPLVRAELQEGRLVEVLLAASIEEPGLFLYFPRHASEARKLRAFIDVMREQLARSGSA